MCSCANFDKIAGNHFLEVCEEVIFCNLYRYIYISNMRVKIIIKNRSISLFENKMMNILKKRKFVQKTYTIISIPLQFLYEPIIDFYAK